MSAAPDNPPTGQPAAGEAFTNPITALAAAAASIHELYQSLVDAGFRDDQALQIVIAMVTNTKGSQQ